MHVPGPISTMLPLTLLSDSDIEVTVGARLSYSAADPFAVCMEMVTGPDDVVLWNFSRDLLSAGTRAAAGEGDIRISPHRVGGVARIRLDLSTPSGQATLEASLAEVVEFLTASYELVPSGAESDFLDVDGLLARLLAA